MHTSTMQLLLLQSPQKSIDNVLTLFGKETMNKNHSYSHLKACPAEGPYWPRHPSSWGTSQDSSTTAHRIIRSTAKAAIMKSWRRTALFLQEKTFLPTSCFAFDQHWLCLERSLHGRPRLKTPNVYRWVPVNLNMLDPNSQRIQKNCRESETISPCSKSHA